MLINPRSICPSTSIYRIRFECNICHWKEHCNWLKEHNITRNSYESKSFTRGL